VVKIRNLIKQQRRGGRRDKKKEDRRSGMVKKRETGRPWLRLKQYQRGGRAKWNKDFTVDDLLDGSYDEEDKNPDDDEEWYKKTDWWKNLNMLSDEIQRKRGRHPKTL
jgi:hypothetical protein